MPAQSVANGLQLDDIPADLNTLTTLERHLISRRIPFSKIVALPRGKQLGIHGPVINVPSTPSTIQHVLPRLATDSSLIPLKLKRKLSYRGHYLYGNIDKLKVSSALNWLLANNSLYTDVIHNFDWESQWTAATFDVETSALTAGSSNDSDSANEACAENDSDDTELYDPDDYQDLPHSQLRGIPYDTCMQV